MANEEYLSPVEAARRLGVTPNTVRAYMRDGLLPRVGSGRYALVPASALTGLVRPARGPKRKLAKRRPKRKS